MVVCSFWKLGSFPLSCQIMSIKLFVLIVFFYCPCDICRHHSDTPCYISLPILVIYVFSLFISVSLVRSLSILLIVVQRTSFFFHWFFSIAFLFSSTLISVCYCFLSSGCFWFTLLLFSSSWGRSLECWFEVFSFPKVITYRAASFSPSCLPRVLAGCTPIFAQFCVFLLFPLKLPLWPMDYLLLLLLSRFSRVRLCATP